MAGAIRQVAPRPKWAYIASMHDPKQPPETTPEPTPPETEEAEAAPQKPRLEPTRYGDWELNGKCVDF